MQTTESTIPFSFEISFASSKVNKPACEIAMLCVCVLMSWSYLFQLFNQLADIYETMLDHRVIRGHPQNLTSDFLHSIITAWRTRALVRCDHRWRHIFCDPEIMYISRANPGGRAVEGVCLQPLASWDCGFHSRQGHGCFVCCKCFVLSGRGPCDGPIPRPQEVYRVCVCVCH
jgi:hypothetical protein